MSIYLITVLNNLNVASIATLMLSILVLSILYMFPDMSNLQRRLVIILGTTMLVFSILWLVFAPNSVLLREWAKESGYGNVEIICPNCRD